MLNTVLCERPSVMPRFSNRGGTGTWDTARTDRPKRNKMSVMVGFTVYQDNYSKLHIVGFLFTCKILQKPDRQHTTIYIRDLIV